MDGSTFFILDGSINKMLKICLCLQCLSIFEVETVFDRSMTHKNAHVLEWLQKNVNFGEFNSSNTNNNSSNNYPKQKLIKT